MSDISAWIIVFFFFIGLSFVVLALMNVLSGQVIVLTSFLLIVLVFFIFSSYSYEISENCLHMRWKILKYLPYFSRKIKINDVQIALRFNPRNDILSGGYIFGNIFFNKGVTILLKKRFVKFYFMKRVFITPSNPDEFIEQINGFIRKQNE